MTDVIQHSIEEASSTTTLSQPIRRHRRLAPPTEIVPRTTRIPTQTEEQTAPKKVDESAAERRLLCIIQWIIYSGVILLTVGAGVLSWSHLTHVAATNGHIAPAGFVFLFPTIIDGFMVVSSGVVVRHGLSDERGVRTWYAGALAAATAALSICLNIQDSTGTTIVPAWILPGIAPTLYMLGTELGLAELRLLMRRLRGRAQQAQADQPPLPARSKREIILAALRETGWQVRETLAVLEDRGVMVDRSYVYEIKRAERSSGEDSSTGPRHAPLEPEPAHSTTVA